ncbi:MAG: hypothetical protein ACRDD7_09390 [Peptostreptococcaceae bacterium]
MLNSKNFNFQMFLGGKTAVESLESGAKKYGGATRIDDKIISNIEVDDFIRIENENEISVFVPSTINVDKVIDNKLYVKEVISMIRSKYNLNDMRFYNTKGSWYDCDGNKVVVENITIVTIRLENIKVSDVNNFINIAEWIKDNMQQQGVSLLFNNALAIV